MKNIPFFLKTFLIAGLGTATVLTACEKEHEHNSAVIEIEEPMAGHEFEHGDTVFIHAHATGETDLHGYELTLTNLSNQEVLFTATGEDHDVTLHMESFWVNHIAAAADVELEVKVFLSHEEDEVETKTVQFKCKS